MAITDSSDPFSGDALSPSPASPPPPAPGDILGRLAALHAEAAQNARLARLLDRAATAAALLLLLGAGALLFAGGADLARDFAWSLLMLLGICVILRLHMRARRWPPARQSPHALAEDLRAALLYTGTAWGAGAFLVLPAAADMASAVLFAAMPALALTLLLRDRRCAFFFIAPVAALSPLAAASQPLAAAGIAGALTLIALLAFFIGGEPREARAPAGFALG